MMTMDDPFESFPEPKDEHKTAKWFTLFALLGVLMLVVVFLITGGCVTASKDLYREMTSTPAPTPTPTPTPEPTIVTPEPTQRLVEFDTGMQPFQFISWRRDNVSGLKDLNMHATVYGYRMFSEVTWWSTSWGNYYTQAAPDGMKYLFVFAHVYSDEGSARTWSIQPHSWYVTANGKVYAASSDLLPEIRLREFENIWDMQHVHEITPYGYLRTYVNHGQPSAEELGFLKAGRSNAHDGYILYIVPEDTKPEDIRVYASLTNTFDNVFWKLE